MSCRFSPILFLALLVAAWCVVPITTGLGQERPTIADTARKLRDVPLPGFPPTEVPADVRPLLKQFKHQLRDVIAETLRQQKHQTATSERIRSAIAENLRSRGVELSKESDTYGYIHGLWIEKPAKHPNLLVVLTTLTVPCGEDSSIYVFQRSASRWNLVLAQESNDYPTVAGAQGNLEYAFSPSDESGNWFLVTADVNPWCTSAWQGLHYKVLRPGATPYEPRVILSKHVGVYEGCDEWYKLAASRNEFQVSHYDSQSLDPAILVRIHLERYAVAGDRVTRIPPLALVPQDFLDEWVNLSWEEAARWTEPTKMEEIRTWHKRLHWSQTRPYYSEFGFVQPCRHGNPSRWQIGLEIDPEHRPGELPEEVFFTVVRKGGIFLLKDISTKRPPGCPGRAQRVSTSGCPKLP
jgi:hypothetical protein